jgi:hypothetical protein
MTDEERSVYAATYWFLDGAYEKGKGGSVWSGA